MNAEVPQEPTTTPVPPPRLRWYQFRLRSLLIVMLLVSLALSWFVVKRTRYRRQEEAVAALRQTGVIVCYDYELDAHGNRIPKPSTPGPEWLRKVLGQNWFAEVHSVKGWSPVLADGTITKLQQLPNLRELRLWYAAELTDAGLMHLEQWPRLECLRLDQAAITDAGLMHLDQLVHLRTLSLEDTRVTDAGLLGLAKLVQLQELFLGCTLVRGTVLERIPEPNGLRFLSLEFCKLHVGSVKTGR